MSVSSFIANNKRAVGIGAGSAVVLLGTAGALYATKKKRRAKNRRTRKARYSYQARKQRRRVKQKQPYTARKRPDTSKRRIRYTRNNQPYVIEMKRINGKMVRRARFIKKSSVSRSKRRSGGRY